MRPTMLSLDTAFAELRAIVADEGFGIEDAPREDRANSFLDMLGEPAPE